VTEQTSEVGVGGERVDGLDGVDGVVGDVAGEVAGGELLFRIEAFFFQLLGPPG
jgi:hypothetical protein